jgi:hypothetical protein
MTRMAAREKLRAGLMMRFHESEKWEYREAV